MFSCLYAAQLPQELAQGLLGHFQARILPALLTSRTQHVHAQRLRDCVDKQLALVRRFGCFQSRASDFIFELTQASLDDFSLAINLQRLKRVGFDVASNRPTAHNFHRLFSVRQSSRTKRVLSALLFSSRADICVRVSTEQDHSEPAWIRHLFSLCLSAPLLLLHCRVPELFPLLRLQAFLDHVVAVLLRSCDRQRREHHQSQERQSKDIR